MIAPDRASYNAIVRRGRSALAWEVLRRDPAYRADYRRIARLAVVGVAADPAFVARWGLHFR